MVPSTDSSPPNNNFLTFFKTDTVSKQAKVSGHIKHLPQPTGKFGTSKEI